MKKIHLKKKRKKINLLFITIILVIISVFYMLNIINKHLTPILIETAEASINKYSTLVVNKAISQILEDKISNLELFTTVINDSGEIQTIDFNPIVVNQVLNLATTVVTDNLTLLENGDIDSIGLTNIDEDDLSNLKKGIISKVPIGVITNNSILSNLGPSIPIRLHYIGDVTSNITTKVEQYGINNALVTVGIKIELTAQIILPLTTTKKMLEYEIPLTIKLVNGSVPNYYGGSIVKDSSLYTTTFEEIN